MATTSWRAKRETRAKTAKPDDGIWTTDELQPVHASRFQTDDLTPQIAKRAYEIYEQRGRQSGHLMRIGFRQNGK